MKTYEVKVSGTAIGEFSAADVNTKVSTGEFSLQDSIREINQETKVAT